MIKDIQGLLNTPPLWINKQFGLKQFVLPSIDHDTFIPKPIPRKLRLGHRIEHLFYQTLSHSKSYEVLAHNIQIKNKNETLGELDFIVRFRESVHPIHIELTYKFYIIDPNISEPIQHLVGPNRKDFFHKKLDKTIHKQLPLAYTDEAIEVLRMYGINASQLKQQVCFLGQLFIPYEQPFTSIHPLNPACIVGFWIQMKDFNASVFSKYSYYITQKHEWIHTPHHDVLWSSYYDTLLEIQIKHVQKRAPILWIKKENGIIEKCFVVWW